MSGQTLSPEYLAESKTTGLNVFASLPIPLEILSTLFRLWVKGGPGRGQLAFDDALMIFATIVSVGLCVTGLIVGPPNGLGRHVEALSAGQISGLLMGDYIISHFYNMAIATTKLSVLALYHRIFAVPKFRYVVIGLATFICCWIIVMEVVLGFGCQPIRAWWAAPEFAPGTFTCVDKEAFTYFTNVCNLTLDLIIFSLPVPMIMRLQATKDRKLSLIFLFSMGLGTCAISAVRLKYIFGVADPDFSWHGVSIGLLSMWEACGGILCANLPLVYRPIMNGISSLRSTLVTSTHRRNGSSDSSNPSSARKRISKLGQSKDWQRLDGSSGLGSSENHITSEAYATKTEDMEKGRYGSETEERQEVVGIVVQRTLHQDHGR